MIAYLIVRIKITLSYNRDMVKLEDVSRVIAEDAVALSRHF